MADSQDYNITREELKQIKPQQKQDLKHIIGHVVKKYFIDEDIDEENQNLFGYKTIGEDKIILYYSFLKKNGVMDVKRKILKKERTIKKFYDKLHKVAKTIPYII